MKQYKALVFRLYPNKIQEAITHQTFGCTRFIYNHYLSKNQQLYQNEKKKQEKHEYGSDYRNLDLWSG